jgi:hypothetical protein
VNRNFQSVGRILLVIFFAAGALISIVVMLALVFPGTDLESIWRLKPEARTHFQTIGRGASAALMAIVATGCGFAAIGLARNREWGRRLAIGILIINLIGDSLDAFIHARRKDFDRFANWWTNDSFSRQDKAIGTMKPWRLQIYLPAHCNCTTTSISAVCGNMSSGVTESMVNFPCSSFKSRASVAGLQDT